MVTNYGSDIQKAIRMCNKLIFLLQLKLFNTSALIHPIIKPATLEILITQIKKFQLQEKIEQSVLQFLLRKLGIQIVQYSGLMQHILAYLLILFHSLNSLPYKLIYLIHNLEFVQVLKNATYKLKYKILIVHSTLNVSMISASSVFKITINLISYQSTIKQLKLKEFPFNNIGAQTVAL